MSEKIRGALFAVLGDISGLSVLDGFAGSGAIGFEAVSRGAASLVTVENDRVAQAIIAKNIDDLGLGSSVQLVQANLAAWLRANPKRLYDVIICDPPYLPLERLPFGLLEHLPKYLAKDGTYVLSWPGGQPILQLPGLSVVTHKQYGDAQLVFYQQTG